LANINKLIAKFIWNRNYAGNRAPNRIKNEILYNEALNGGFGMIKLDELVNCIRIKRFSILEDGHEHPVGTLQTSLGSKDHLRCSSLIEIDPTTSAAMKSLTAFNVTSYQHYDIDNLENDRLCRIKLCGIKLVNIIPRNKNNTREATTLRRLNIRTIHDLLTNEVIDKNILLTVCIANLRSIFGKLIELEHTDHDNDFLTVTKNHYIVDIERLKWHNLAIAGSASIRRMLYKRNIILQAKISNFEPETAQILYRKISKLNSVALKTKILRLIHRDVYCGARLVKFGLSETDICIRCMKKALLTSLNRIYYWLYFG